MTLQLVVQRGRRGDVCCGIFIGGGVGRSWTNSEILSGSMDGCQLDPIIILFVAFNLVDWGLGFHALLVIVHFVFAVD